MSTFPIPNSHPVLHHIQTVHYNMPQTDVERAEAAYQLWKKQQRLEPIPTGLSFVEHMKYVAAREHRLHEQYNAQ